MSTHVSCPICSASVPGRFCDQCGAAVAPRQCAGCGAGLSPVARFCHRCGRQVGTGTGGRGRSAERVPWLVAGILIISGLSWIALKGINRNAPTAVPDMANVGNAPGGGQAVSAGQGRPPGMPPDLGSMSPDERFNRLYDRVMRATSGGNPDEARQFLPMALMAYGQVDTLNADLRYHAAVLYSAADRFPEALALADTILAEHPGHLFGYLVRAEVADRRQDTAALTKARGEFMQQYAREITRTDRPEYLEHKPVLDEFRTAGKGDRGTP